MSSFLSQLPPTEPLKPGRYGAFPAMPGVQAKHCDVSLATLVAGRNGQTALSEAVKAAVHVSLPKAAFVQGGELGFVGTGPGRWTVCSDQSADALLETLERIAGAAASVTDQSDGVVVYELTGPKVRETLAKLVDIDVDAAVFKAGSAATTHVALIGSTFWQIDDRPTIRMTVARSYAPAFLRALAGAAAEYGFELI